MEIWKDIPDYEGIYQVSNLGNIRSFKNGGYGLRIEPKLLKPSIAGCGYLKTILSKNGIEKNGYIHRLVALAFLNHKSDGTHNVVIDHINNIKTDNRVENLQLTNNRYNCSKDRKGLSKFTGVSFDKQTKKWRAEIYVNGSRIKIGRFTCELAAAQAYQKALKTINT
jgi:hypothetical protein